jgi:hypothetical protein
MAKPMRRCLLAGLSVATACAPVGPSTKPSPARFYASRDFGSESQFNPVSAIINDGFDFLHTSGTDPHVFTRDYAGAFRNVMTSVLQPDRTYRHYGVSRALRNEWFPLTGQDNKGGGSWIPNYEYHLFGSGMVSVRMEEWYAQHGASHPTLAAIGTVMVAHLLNEVIENDTFRGLNQDAATDLLIFDPLGILVWRSEAVQRFFSEKIQMTNWPGQPSVDINSRTLQNLGQQYMLRGRVPGTKQWRVLYIFGLGGVLGFSYGDPRTGAWSAAIGPYAENNPIVDSLTLTRTATLRANAGIYYDREGSLLFSANYSPKGDRARLNVNVYPGVLRFGNVRPGFWLQTVPGGRIRVGLASRWGIGLGLGPER